MVLFICWQNFAQTAIKHALTSINAPSNHGGLRLEPIVYSLQGNFKLDSIKKSFKVEKPLVLLLLKRHESANCYPLK